MWKVINCIPKFNLEKNEIEFTEIQIMKDTEYAVISGKLKGDFTKENEERLVELTLEDFYEKTYPNRAENEKFKKFDELIQDMKEQFSKEMLQMKVAFAELVEEETGKKEGND